MRVAIALLSVWALSAQELSQSGLELTAARPMVAQHERAQSAMIASAHELASEAGLGILRAGGNAVDAAVAVGFALAVVHPEAGNLGGGGYMVIRMADGRTKAIDYRETAPSVAKPDWIKTPMEARVGYRASAVPGTVAGLALAHKLYGALRWDAVLEPARRLAKNGFPASQRMELILALQVPVMKQFPETAKIFLHGSDRPLKQGEIVVQMDLAKTIARLQKQGPREFYEGETARRIVRDMEAQGGGLRAEDLRSYQALQKEPLAGTYRGHTILTVPPSSSGGFAVLQMLNILERFDIPLGAEGSSATRHLLIEAMRRAFRDRAEFAADPAFTPVPVERLVSKEHGKELAGTIRADRATTEMSALPKRSSYESADTTHFSIVDRAGNLVANTYTLNDFFGSQVVAKGTGVLLNDIMAGFSNDEGEREMMAPGKKPVSSMTPTIVLRPGGRPWVALGSPGSQTIPNTVTQTIVNLIDFKMALRDAIEYPRVHHQYRPDRVELEPGALVADVAEKLRSMGHIINTKSRSQGDVHAAGIDEDGWRIGWSDGRRGGRAVGY